MARLRVSPVILLTALILALAPSQARADIACRLCEKDDALDYRGGAAAEREQPLRISVATHLDFSSVAMRDHIGGAVALDPATGDRSISGALTSLGGPALLGEVRLTGEPGRAVRVDLPERIVMSAPDGGTVELTRLETDLPPRPQLDRDGRLNFAFGGRLEVKGRAGGQYRGRIRISADYE